MFFELEHIPLSSFASLSGIAYKCQVKYLHFAVLREWFCLEAAFSMWSRSVISSGLQSQALTGFHWCGRGVPTGCARAVAGGDHSPRWAGLPGKGRAVCPLQLWLGLCTRWVGLRAHLFCLQTSLCAGWVWIHGGFKDEAAFLRRLYVLSVTYLQRGSATCNIHPSLILLHHPFKFV